MLANYTENIKLWWDRNSDAMFWGMALFFGTVLITGLLQLRTMQDGAHRVQFYDVEGEEITQSELHRQYIQASGLPGLVAASRNGKRYYYPWCGGLSRIKQANLIWFSSEQSAESAGYTIAAGCHEL